MILDFLSNMFKLKNVGNKFEKVLNVALMVLVPKSLLWIFLFFYIFGVFFFCIGIALVFITVVVVLIVYIFCY